MFLNFTGTLKYDIFLDEFPRVYIERSYHNMKVYEKEQNVWVDYFEDFVDVFLKFIPIALNKVFKKVEITRQKVETRNDTDIHRWVFGVSPLQLTTKSPATSARIYRGRISSRKTSRRRSRKRRSHK